MSVLLLWLFLTHLWAIHIIIIIVFLECLSMWNMLNYAEQVQTQKYKNIKHIHIRHPVWQHVQLSEQIHPWDTLACCWDIKQPTNNNALFCPALSSNSSSSSSVFSAISLGFVIWGEIFALVTVSNPRGSHIPSSWMWTVMTNPVYFVQHPYPPWAPCGGSPWPGRPGQFPLQWLQPLLRHAQRLPEAQAAGHLLQARRV